MKYIKFAIISIIALSVSFANTYAKPARTDIKGKILEKGNNTPLAFATITVLSPDNKVVKGGTSGDSGEFSFTALAPGKYKVQISFIGYKNLELPLEVTGKDVDMGNIEIEPDAEQLAAAVVTAKVPLIEQKLDKVVMNVSESVMASINNGFEILRKAPGISVDPDGNILLNGQAVDIWIDNRPSRLNGAQLETLLSSLDGNTIEKIEIMQHPSAKFDASGSGGIINIKTKKNFIKGFYGNVSMNYDAYPYKDFHQGANGSINLNYRSEHANTYVTYTPRFVQGKINIIMETLFGEDYQNKQISDSYMGGDRMQHYAKAGSDLYINDKNTLGFLVATTLSNNKFDSFRNSLLDTYTESVLTGHVKSDIKQNDDMNILDANLYYTRTFSPVSDLTINADYNYFEISNGSFQRNKYYDPQDYIYTHAFNNDMKQYVNIYSLKADYKTLFLKKGMIETGAKWTRTNTLNDMVRTDSLNHDYEYNRMLSSNFNYREDVSAAYVSVSYQFNPKWSVMAGLRGEYTNTRGDWKTADTVTTQRYFDIFPTIFAGYTPSKDWRLSLSYTIRVQRPRFMQLNPFRIYVDANGFIVGNPELKPQYTHQLSISAGYKSFLNFGLTYQRTGNFISQDPFFDNITGEKQIKWTNFGVFTLIGANASISELPLINKTLFFSINGVVSNAISKSTVKEYKESKLFWQLYGSLTAVLPKDFKLELSANYQNGMPFGYMNISPVSRVNFGIKKSFWNNKGTFSLGIDDIFGGGNLKIKMYEKDLLVYVIDQRQFTRTLYVGFNYKFGNVQGKNRTNKRDDTSSRVGGM